ncbi:rRNA methyltransferase [Heterostelium album PN500]|uniref:Putative rRNA methyltransferase n=1 Tax=Heterostelium pallidum (strain ATCC 26659 / Pp 5 / PN500) TaxID=670386 RepID=D3AZ34_HETP5|nr:rRNA methyltransferase [Heterostelium album PN500]EFA85591.1 rRNA methyltransferase [Heterostelium album PN500]|eukprot:XP_020437698.1 rRNA methyltransferase [Heterostelium album PN500]
MDDESEFLKRMGQKKKKLAKGRLDKFYYLAKEQGYRSRAAFKLIQLNKKYNFLGSAKACLDLCAAPGGWMQVASKYMPVQSLIVGVDLDPIRPIKNCIGLQEDITTQKCRTEIKKSLKTWKVDICLHDGAPNMGTSWIQDAYQQAELTLHALKLATEFLVAGGWFVTKVFRGPDYNALLWVFHQLFKKVDSTKPQASRNASAEIFVVCQGFLAPKHIDPKLLDPKYVFKEIKEAPKHIDLGKTTTKRNRSGYEEGITEIAKTATVKDFVEGNDHLKILASVNSLQFDVESKMYFDHPSTTTEIKECFKDIKVLGKFDFKVLIKWKKEMLEYKESLEGKKEEEAAQVEQPDTNRLLTQEELDENLDKLLEENQSKLEKRKKKEKKKQNEKKRVLQQRLQLNMTIPGDSIDQIDDNNLFDLQKGKDDQFEIDASADVDPDEIVDSEDEMNQEEYENDEDFEMDNEEFMEQQLDEQYSQYLKRVKGKSGEVDVSRVTKDKLSDYSGKGMDDLEIEDDETMEMKLSDNKSSLLYDGKKRATSEKSASMWFNQSLFRGVTGDDEDTAAAEEDPELDRPIKLQKTSTESKSTTKKESKKSKKDKSSSSSSKYQSAPTGQLDDSDEEQEDAKQGEDNQFEVVPMEQDIEYESSDSEDEDSRIKTLAMGTMMLRKKVKQDMTDDAFNRYAFNDDDLPDWFTQDEDRHNKPQTPLTKEMVEEIKREIREIDSRPIKKIAEAKARKKYRTAKRLEKLKDKANSVVDNEEMSNREKTRAIEKLYENSNKAGHAKQKKLVVISKKFKTGGGSGSKYKVVDKRMKKELRATKRVEAKKKGTRK